MTAGACCLSAEYFHFSVSNNLSLRKKLPITTGHEEEPNHPKSPGHINVRVISKKDRLISQIRFRAKNLPSPARDEPTQDQK